MAYVRSQRAAFYNNKLICRMGECQVLNLEHDEHNEKINKLRSYSIALLIYSVTEEKQLATLCMTKQNVIHLDSDIWKN